MADVRRRRRRRTRQVASFSGRDVIASTAILMTPFAVIFVDNPQNIKAIVFCAVYVSSAMIIWNMGWLLPYNPIVKKISRRRAGVVLILSFVFVALMTSGFINFDAPQMPAPEE